jgi:hypothetical protein
VEHKWMLHGLAPRHDIESLVGYAIEEETV